MSMAVDDDAVVVLAADAVQGDKAAAAALLTHVRPAIVRYCRARLGRVSGTYDMADDVAQEVCLAVLTALPRYRDEGRPFGAFVFGIAAHKVADAWRFYSRRPVPRGELPDGADPTPGPEERAVEADQVSRARELLKLLPEQAREVVLMRMVAGLSAEETADALGHDRGRRPGHAAPRASPAARPRVGGRAMSDWDVWDDEATPSLSAIALDDMVVDALAAGDLADDTDPALLLLAALRDDVEPDSAHVVPLRGGRPRWHDRATRWSRRAVAASAAAVTVLSAGGVAAASVGAGPDSVLYPVRKVLVGPEISPLGSVQILLASAQQALSKGDVNRARQQVTAARKKLASLDEDTGKARQSLSALEGAVAAADTATASPTSGSSAGAGSTTPTGPGTSDPSTATTVDQGATVDSQSSDVPSPTPSGDPSTSPSPSDSAEWVDVADGEPKSVRRPAAAVGEHADHCSDDRPQPDRYDDNRAHADHEHGVDRHLHPARAPVAQQQPARPGLIPARRTQQTRQTPVGRGVQPVWWLGWSSSAASSTPSAKPRA